MVAVLAALGAGAATAAAIYPAAPAGGYGQQSLRTCTASDLPAGANHA
jgi:hypothetical protein